MLRLALIAVVLLPFMLWAEEGAEASHAQDLLVRAQGGDTAAQMELAQRYHEGKGVPRSPQQVNWWLQQAADNGHLLAQMELAKRYLAGTGMTASETDALHWFEKASQGGSAEAKYHVAMLGLSRKKNSRCDCAGTIIRVSRFGICARIFSIRNIICIRTRCRAIA